MPTLGNTYAEEGAFIMLMAPPLNGKTTLVGHLLEHTCPVNGKPYELFVVDLDKQLTPILHGVPKEHWSRCHYIQPVESMTVDSATGIATPTNFARTWNTVNNLPTRWRDGNDMAEPYREWGPERVVVIDSLSVLNDIAIVRAQESGVALRSEAHGGSRLKSGRYKQVKDYGPAAEILLDHLKAWKYMSPRRFHVIVTAHVSHKSIDVMKTATPEEVNEALSSPEKRKELAKRSQEMVTIYDPKYTPITTSKGSAGTILKLFQYALAASKEDTRVRLQTRDDARYCLRANDPERKMAAFLPARDGLAKVLEHHLMVGHEHLQQTEAKS